MSSWTEQQKNVALCFGSFAAFTSASVAFLGFPGFKSVNVIAVMLAMSASGIVVCTVAFIGGKLSRRAGWEKARRVGWMLAVAPLVYVAFELANPIL